MITSTHRIRFIMTLRGLYGLMRFTAFHSPAFKEKIASNNLVLTMTARSEDVPRTFRFQGGSVGFESGRATDSMVRLIWSTPEKGAKIMMDMAMGNPKALMNAVISGDLQLEGDAMGIRWYLDLITMLSKTYRFKRSRKKKKPTGNE